MASETLNWSKPDRLGDRHAEAGGIRFTIYRSTTGFGLAAVRGDENLTGPGISWFGTMKRCKQHAARLLAKTEA